MTELSIGAALLLGLLGSSHCLVMCGGISVALGMGSAPQKKTLLLSLFQLGRISTYTLLGAGLGALLGKFVLLSEWVFPALRLLSGVLLVAMGLYIANWWRGLTMLERAGQALWRRLQPRAQKHLPVRSAGDALLIGLYWGFLPCGLIYTALAWTATAANWQQSALLMACFGFGTLPAMYASGLAGERIAALLRQRGLRKVAAILLIVAGSWTGFIALQHQGHTDQAAPDAHQHQAVPAEHQH
ncbi:MAG: sulfite exporter TauE/SafE family protein [Halieaceae bacterium]